MPRENLHCNVPMRIRVQTVSSRDVNWNQSPFITCSCIIWYHVWINRMQLHILLQQRDINNTLVSGYDF